MSVMLRRLQTGDYPRWGGVIDLAAIKRELDPGESWLAALIDAVYDIGHAEGETCDSEDNQLLS